MTKIIGLEKFIPKVTPRFQAPTHLRSLTQAIERIADGEAVRELVSVPSRHGKTEVTKHGMAWLAVQRPHKRIAFLMYGNRVAERKGKQIRDLYLRAGVPIATDSKSKRDWITGVDDGGMWISSRSGAVTSEGFDVIFCDDLLKGRSEAESPTIRDATYTWFAVDVMSRLEPGGSVVVTNTRWHVDDPIGRLFTTGEWNYTNLPALAVENDPLGRQPGEPLWPERWSREALEKICRSLGGERSYEWLSLYQGTPLGRSDQIFKDAFTYDRAPESFEQIRIGCDFAYSVKSHADYSVAVVLGTAAGVHYLIDVLRIRTEPRDFRNRVLLLLRAHPGAMVSAYVSATERGSIEFFREAGIEVDARTAVADKFSRAIPTAAAWNSGKILVPSSAPWANAFVSELVSFSGSGKGHDDQVDALSAAFDSLSKQDTDLRCGWARSRRDFGGPSSRARNW